MSLYITYHDMCRCGGVGEYFHAFLTYVLNGSEFLALRSGRFPLREQGRGTRRLNGSALLCQVFGCSSLTLTTTFSECREKAKLSGDHK